MEELATKIVRLGEPVPDFALPNMGGQTTHLSDYRGKVVVLNFWSPECPVSRIYDTYFSPRLADYAARGVILLAISSDVTVNTAQIREAMVEHNLQFPVLLDQNAAVADQFGAMTTPHIFVVDAQGRLVYEGAVDNRGFRKPPTQNYLEPALEAVLAGRTPDPARTPSYGCTINRVHIEGQEV